MMDAIADQAMRQLDQFSTQHISNISWAYAKMEYPPWELLNALSAESVGKLSECASLHLTGLQWAYVTLQYEEGDLPLLSAIQGQLLKHVTVDSPVVQKVEDGDSRDGP